MVANLELPAGLNLSDVQNSSTGLSKPEVVLLTYGNIEDQVKVFNLLFTQVLNVHAPVKKMKIRLKLNPYITPEVKALMRQEISGITSQSKPTIVCIGISFLQTNANSI